MQLLVGDKVAATVDDVRITAAAEVDGGDLIPHSLQIHIRHRYTARVTLIGNRNAEEGLRPATEVNVSKRCRSFASANEGGLGGEVFLTANYVGQCCGHVEALTAHGVEVPHVGHLRRDADQTPVFRSLLVNRNRTHG